ncbi:Protein fam72a [Mortierella sp. GBA30]|nr:Protein fam72a [Mortierella sp. GBA30]
MPQYPPPQHQHYNSTSAGHNSNNNNSGSGGSGYSNAYVGGGNSDRYNSSYSSHHVSSMGPGAIGGGGTHSKTVCRMDCRYCSAVVCLRGMKAMLLADTSVELYSTDHPPGSVQLIDKDYTTSNCKCKIRDVACRVCGNVIGYHITQPCQQCLRAPNNGHFWMFHTEGVIGQERLNLDLAKLVQELVNFPHNVHQGHTGARLESTATARGEGGGMQRETIVSTTGWRATTVARYPAEAATTRQTSDARLRQQQQQQYLSRPRLLTTSPSPTTPTPSTLPERSVVSTANSTSTTNSSSVHTTEETSEVMASSVSNITLLSERSYSVMEMMTTPRRTEQPVATTDTSNIDQAEAEVPMSPAAVALSQLSLSKFLQPMRWEQLPHPDLDIDLDPSTMGGEPLFATQWVELVRKSAEAAAANMTLALDQEEETERYVQRMMSEGQLSHRELEASEASEEELEFADGNDDEDDVIGLEPEVEVEVEIEVEILEEDNQTSGFGRGMDIEQLIDQVDGFGLTNTSSSVAASDEGVAEEIKDEIEEDLGMDVDDDEPRIERGRTLERRQQGAQSEEAPMPGQEQNSSTPTSAGERSTGPHGPQLQRLVRSSSQSSETTVLLTSSESCPTVALASAVIAKAAASAAAADAASAANNLVFGRRSRRDYDMICR